MKWNIGPIPPGFRNPSTSQINPPVETKAQELPFGELSWKDFEKLCLCLIEEEDEVEHCQFYGTPGQGQEGIDIYAKKRSEEKYTVYQCKRVKNFGPSSIGNAVSKFLQGNWIDKSDKFVLCASDGFDSRLRADEVETQRSILEKKGIQFDTWDKYKLSSKLKQYPEIVDDFFGRGWVKAFCSIEAANKLEERLDVNEVIELRNELKNFYQQIFELHDHVFPIQFNTKTISLEKRYVFPDIDDVRVAEQSNDDFSSQHFENLGRTDLNMSNYETGEIRKHYSAFEFQQRQGFENWLYMSDHSVVLGGPGSGKSTLLRFIAIDLLSDYPQLNLLSSKWGQFIPIWIPFSSWTKRISDNLDGYSLKKFIKSWLATWGMGKLWPLIEKALNDKKVLLLVDGLDEWINEQTAKIASNRLKTFINSNKVPAIVSSRPHGFERLGIRENGWQMGSLSDFSAEQQEQLSKIWFKYLLKNQRESLNEEKLDIKVKFETERLFNELHNSPELKELAKIPLLLCLLIYHKYRKHYLPQSRFKAYDSLINHLINEHPQMRREAADITDNQFELDVNEIKLNMEYLAYNIQEHYSNGIIEYSEALAILEKFLENDEGDFRFPPYKARQYSREILEMNEENFGLIVKQSQNEIGFLHRIFQEYLAGSYISRKNQNEQKLILKTYCADSQWREVVLSFFNIISGSGNIENLIEYIRSISKETNIFNQYSIELIIYEIVFGNFNCPAQLSKDLALEAFDKVELGSWMPQRERILRLILNGLISESIQETVQLKLKQWFLNRYGWQQENIYDSMHDWPKKQEVVECLWKGIHDEKINNQRAAAKALAAIANGDPEIGNKIAFLAKTAVDANVRAVAIESLLNGWSTHKDLVTILKSARGSISPEIRLMAIIGRITKKTHTEEDLDELIYLGSWRSSLGHTWQEDIVNNIIKGWPRSDKIKKICLKSLKNGISREERLYHGTDLMILIKGYPQDEEVAHYLIEEFRKEKLPLISISDRRNFYRLLANNFKNHSGLVYAVDKWAEDTTRVDISYISSLASIGCTDKIKQILLKTLNQNNYNSRWAANSLIENWGLEDNEVKEKLTDFVFSSNEIASLIGYLIPKIILDKAKCRKRLLELLKDTNHHNHYFVLLGLKELKDTEEDNEVVDIVFDILPHINDKVIIQALIEYYPLNQKVKQFAIRELSKRTDEFSNVSIITRNYKGDEAIRKKIINKICIIPSNLREIIAKRLGDSNSEDEFTMSLLNLYDFEQNDTVKTQASISYYNLLKSSAKDIKHDLDYLDHTINAVGMDFEKRRLAAFCGLIIMKQLNNYKNKISFSNFYHYKTNIPFFRLILENLEYINASLGDDFWYDSSKGVINSLYMQEEFYLLADEFPTQRDEAINFIKNHGKDRSGFLFNILNFLSRNCPKSRLLLDHCLKAFKDESNSYGSLRDILIATKILGNHFCGDNEILEYIISNMYIGPSKEKLILVLCEVCPESEKLTTIFNEFKEEKINPGLFTSLQLICQKGETELVFNGISHLLSDCSIESMPSWIIQEFKRPLIHRIQKDNKFRDMLIKSLYNNSCSSFKATIPRLISASGKITPEFRKWCTEELNNQLSPTNSPEIGMDLVAGELRPVAHSILDIL
jgi:hypothetical protein